MSVTSLQSSGGRWPRRRGGGMLRDPSLDGQLTVLESRVLPERALKGPGAALWCPPYQNHLQFICHPYVEVGGGRAETERAGQGSWQEVERDRPHLHDAHLDPRPHDTSYNCPGENPGFLLLHGKFGRHVQSTASVQPAATCRKPSATERREAGPCPHPNPLSSKEGCGCLHPEALGHEA